MQAYSPSQFFSEKIVIHSSCKLKNLKKRPMNYNLNPTFYSFKGSNQQEKGMNVYLFNLFFAFLFFLIFPNQNSTAQIPANCVGSTSIQKYTGSMRPNDFLAEGQNLTSANGKFHLRVTEQGELVIEEILQSQNCGICNEQITMRAGRGIWKAPAGGRLNNPPKVSLFTMNQDCNLCFNSNLNKGWCATNGIDENRAFLWKCDKVILTNDGRLVLIDKNRREMWSNRSPKTTPYIPSTVNNPPYNPVNNPTTNPSSYDEVLQVSNSDLRTNLLNVNHNVVNVSGKGGANQDKSKLNMGTHVCLNLSDGTTAKAMVVGQGLYYGPKQDSYAIDIIEGPRRGQRYYMKPYQIDKVGECAQAYIPSPSPDVPADLNLELLEQKIVNEINIIRANPSAYADELAKLKYTKFGPNNNSFHAIAIGNDLMMRCYDNNQNCQNENLRKLQTAINYLRSIPEPLTTLKTNSNLAKASSLLASDIGNIKGHIDSQGRSATCRAEQAGYPSVMLGECLDSGYRTASAFVISLLNSPPHRNIIMNKSTNEIGVDVHRHGSGRTAYLRNVIMVGNSNYPDQLGSCNKQ